MPVIFPVAACLFATAVHAIPMQGSLKFNLDTNPFSFDETSVDFADADSGNVSNASGDFTGAIGTDVVFKDFVFASFTDAISDLWSVPTSGISFDLVELLHYEYIAEGGAEFLLLAGRGVAHMAGFDSTAGLWTLSADGTGGAYNYSSIFTADTPNVPEGGSILALFGLTLLGAAIASRRFSKSRMAAR